MIYVSCFHNLYAIAWPDSLEAVENIAKREFFLSSALCFVRSKTGVGRDYCLRGDKNVAVVEFITPAAALIFGTPI